MFDKIESNSQENHAEEGDQVGEHAPQCRPVESYIPHVGSKHETARFFWGGRCVGKFWTILMKEDALGPFMGRSCRLEGQRQYLPMIRGGMARAGNGLQVSHCIPLFEQ